MRGDELFIGVDVGTTSVKAGLFDARGSVLAHEGTRYPSAHPAPGVVEQNPDDWVRAVNHVVDAVLSGRDPRRVAAVGFCSQVNTDVFVDAAGRPLAPAIVWQDVRAAQDAAALDADISPADRQRWWAAPLPVGASHVLARMRWMARTRPDVFAATRHVLTPKDFCLRALAGVTVSDPMSNFFVVGRDLDYVRPLLDRLPGAADCLPPLHAVCDLVGEITLGGTGRSAPVVAGTMDAWSGLFGSGVHRAGQGTYMSGTSEILAVATEPRGGAPGVVTFPTMAGFHVHAGPTQSGGDSLRWWAEASGNEIAAVLRSAADADRRERPILFLPQLEGERAPLWDSGVRGAFIGLDRRTEGPDLALAVLEGVALSARLLAEALESAAAQPTARWFMAGGGAASDLWCQIRADCLARPLDRVAFADVGCLGGAIMASVGAGVHPSLTAAIRAMTKVGRTFEPDPARRSRYDALFETYRLAIDALRPLGLIDTGA